MIAKSMNWARANPKLSIFLYCFLFSLLISPGTLGRDSERRLQVTHWLWGNGPQVAPDDTYEVNRLIGRNGEIFAQFSIGQSLVMLPADLLAHNIMKVLPSIPQKQLNELIVSYSTFPLINALCLLFVFLLCSQMGLGNKCSAISCLIFQWCTSFLAYCQSYQENNLILLSLLGGLYFTNLWLNDRSAKWLLIAGICLGFSLLIRITAITAFAAWILYVGLSLKQSLYKNLEIRRITWQILLAFIPVVILFAGIDRGYQFYRFENWTGTYANEIVKAQKQAYPQYVSLLEFPAWKGFLLQLFHPRKSIFLFEIALWLAVPLIVYRQGSKFFKSLHPLLVFAITCFLLTAWIYGGTTFWHGDSAWGPRHISTFAQLISLPLIATWVFCHFGKFRSDSSLAKGLRLGWCMLAIACLVQIEGLVLYHSLEDAQYKAGSPLVVPHIQRMVNLTAFATGNFEHWGLSYGRQEAVDLAKLRLQFMPFLLLDFLPISVTRIIIALWLLLITTFAGFTFVLLRRLTRQTE